MEALARIDHPGVVGVLDFGELPESRRLYLIMQFVKGVRLRDAMAHMGMNLERVAALVAQLGQAPTAVHMEGVCHRDLKPENIMLQTLSDGSEQVKLIDFGLAGIRKSTGVVGGDSYTVAGSPA